MDDLQILVKAIVDDKSESSMDSSLKSIVSKLESSHKVELKVGLDDASVKVVQTQLQAIAKQVTTTGKSGSVQVFDSAQLQADGRRYFSSAKNIISSVQKEFKNMGKVDVTNVFKNAKGDIQSFTANVTKANGVVERFNFSVAQIKDGTKTLRGFVQTSSVLSDKSAGSGLQKTLDYLNKINSKIAEITSKTTKNTSKPLLSGMSEFDSYQKKLQAVNSRIEEIKSSSSVLSSEHKREINSMVSDLQRYARELQSAAYASTDLKANTFSQRKEELQAALKTDIQKWQQSGLFGGDFEKSVNEAKALLDSALEPTDLDNYRHKISLIGQEFKQIKLDKSSSGKLLDADRLNTNIQTAQQRLLNLKQTYSAFVQDPKLLSQWDELFDESKVVSSQKELTNLNAKIRLFEQQIIGAGKNVKSFWDNFTANASKMGTWMILGGVISAAMRGVTGLYDAVVDLDTAMVELKKVTNETDSAYDKFLTSAAKKAVEIGTSYSDFVNSTADFARLGYAMEDAQGLAEVANIYAVVGDEIGSVDTATSSIISTMKAFGIEASNAMTIVDKFNEVGNNFSISSGGIGEAMQRSASSLAEANNTLDESIALIVAANNVIQDPDTVGTMWKTVSMRIRGAKTELEEAGLETEFMAESTASLRDEIQALTNVDGTGGFDILLNDETFKSTYDIILGISKVWKDMNDIDQAALLELLAGKRQGNALAAAITNMDDAVKVLQTSVGAEGSALREHERWMDSIQAKQQQFQAQYQALANTILNSGLIKFGYDAGTGLLGWLTNLVDTLGALPTLVTAITPFFSKLQSLQTTTDKNWLGSGLGITTRKEALNMVNQRDISLLDSYVNKLKNLGIQNDDLQRKQIVWNETIGDGSDALKSMVCVSDDATKSSAAYKAIISQSSSGLDKVGIKAKAAAIGVQVLNTAMNMLINMGISLAINAIISGFAKLIDSVHQSRQEIIENGQDAAQSANDLYNLATSYLELSQAVEEGKASQEDLDAVQDSLISSLEEHGVAVQNLTGDYQELRAAMIEAVQQGLETDISLASAAANEMQKQSISDLVTFFGGNSTTSSAGDGVIEALEYLRELGYAGISTGTKGGTISLPNSTMWQLGEEASFEEMVENYKYLEGAMNAVREKFGTNNPIFTTLSGMYTTYNTALKDTISHIDSVNSMIAKNELLELEKTNNADTLDEFKQFRSDLIEATKGDLSFNTSGGKSAEEIVDALLGQNASYKDLLSQLKSQEATAENLDAKRQQILKNISEATKKEFDNTKSFIEGLTATQEVLNSQATGVSMSLNDFNSEELAAYNSALEYNNGALQLNAEKVNEIVQAKAKEQIAINNANKAISQAEYLKNAAEIEKLRDELDGLSDTEVDARNAIQSKIDTLLSENEVLRDSCTRYDLMSASIREATNAYQHWLNAQNASQSGDMFDEALNAITHINDTLNNTKSDLYGRVGRTDYQAAVDFIVPDTVDKEDADAVNKYIEGIGDMFLYDGDGGFVGLNIENFCREAVEAGLMELNDAGTAYQIAGRKTMEDFADGLGLALPLVQAMFGEMEEFGGSFDWADEANKTIGDLGVSATVAAEALRSIKGNESLKIDLDVSDIEVKDDKIVALNETIAEMQNLKKTKVGIDASEIEYANQIIEYCVAQKLQLENPAVLDIDLTKLSDSAAEAVSLMQEFKTAYNELELQKSLGLDITDAQANVENLRTQIESSENAYLISLELDSTSVDTLNSTITSLEMPEIKTVFGIDDSALLSYEADNKEATVIYGVDHSAVDAYSPSDLHRTVYYYYKTVGSPPSGGGDSELNGTAHASGTARASGDWGTAPGGKTLLGELGLEIVVDPHTGKWYTVGETGAEFVNIPRGAIVFNHKQSESLLRSGYVAGRGTAHAYGTAAVSGFMPVSGITSNKYHGTSGGYSGSNTSTSDSNSTNDSTTKDTISEFERLYKEHQHLLAMDKESLEAYTRWLSQAYVDAYAQGQIELEDYYKYAEEVYENMQDIFMDSLDDAEHQIDLLEHEGNNAAKIELIYRSLMSSVEKEIAAAKANGLDETDDYVQELQQKWMSYSKEIMDMQEDAADDAKSSVEDLVDYRVDMLKQELKDQQDSLDDKLDNLKEFYDKQKEMLQKQYDEEKVIEERNEKRKAKSDIEAELAKLEFDDSAWAQKRKLELQAELASAEKDLADFEKDQALEQAENILDSMYEQQEALIQTEIEAIEERLNDPNALYNQALSDIVNNTESLYGEMVEYNNKHGDGNPDTVKEMWEEAFVSLNNYLHLFGEAYKGIILTNATGYASGTSSATSGWHRFDEDGSEYIMARHGSGKYRLFSDGDKVLSSPAASFLYNFAESRGGIIDNLVGSLISRISTSRNGLQKALQSISNSNTANQIDMSGDIIIQGNADEKTVSEIRREKRKLVEFVLEEFKKLSR